VDLVEDEPVAEQRLGLRELRREARERERLLLVQRRVYPPAGGVAVAPLAADRDRVARHVALAEPSREELLRAPIAARDVDVTDTRCARDVEQLGGARVERLGRPRRRQVVRASEVDVARPADGREPEAEARDGDPRRAERPRRDHG
jgi:hypothetical protein